ncbi:MAG: hypothetical protein LH618_20390 [Saprospiraceae bacterium]|nr:hypothetical protein [Saprospiraceae bacterium]
MAAFLAIFDRGVETIGAFGGQHWFEGRRIGGKNFDGLFVAFEGARPGGLSLLKIAPGIEGEYADGQLVRKNEVGNYLVFQTETGGKGGPPGKTLRQKLQRLERVTSVEGSQFLPEIV